MNEFTRSTLSKKLPEYLATVHLDQKLLDQDVDIIYSKRLLANNCIFLYTDFFVSPTRRLSQTTFDATLFERNHSFTFNFYDSGREGLDPSKIISLIIEVATYAEIAILNSQPVFPILKVLCHNYTSTEDQRPAVAQHLYNKEYVQFQSILKAIESVAER